jgi:hypothetical protein
MDVIYRLADDFNAKVGMQGASVRPDGHGLRQTHGLICSAEWWLNVQSGALETHIARGVIRGIWFGHWHRGPAEFQMELPDGTLFGGLCNLEPEDADRAFTLGRIAEVDYVLQFMKTPEEGTESASAIWLEIRLGDTVPYKVRPLPHTEENFGRFTLHRDDGAPHAPQLEAMNPWRAFWR